MTVYDRHDRAGGLLTYGIPGFKLEKQVVMRRIARLEAGGIVFRLGFAVGCDATLDALRGRHDALVIATGVYAPRALATPGDDLPGVVEALDYLIASNRVGFGDIVPAYDDGTLNALNKNVIVVGGGDTAMDCVRTAVRQGAASVRCLYRRDRANMPGSQREVTNAEEEGVVFEWLSAPERFLGAVRIERVAVRGMRLGAPDSGGRRTPEADRDSLRELPADMVVKALGFDPEDVPTLFGAPDLAITRWGTLRVDERMMTSLDGVFAGGDIVRGASLVVWGIRDGMDVAGHINAWLTAKAASERRAA